MAKSKSNSSDKSKSAAPRKRSPAANRGGASSSSSGTTRKNSRGAISGHEIGRIAGEIWSLLNNNGDQTLAAIKQSVDAPPDVAVAAIGWLAREDKLEFTTSGRTVKVSLR